MTTVEIRTPAGGTDGTLDLPAEIFDVAVSEPLIHQVVVAQLAAARSGNHSSKNKAEVRGGGRKPYRQKGTGRARQGSTRAPQFAGGGTVHGPTPRDYSQRTPKKMKAAALRQILSDRARHDRISVISAVIEGETPSTKSALATLGDWMADGRILLVLDAADTAGWRSLRNINAVQLASVEQFNAYDVVVSDRVVFSKDALESFLTRGNKKSEQGSDA
ncbi:50S ribosomal protein L4 [Candidatus Nanopelagicales bacterium]|nr:50S ribosomal protein L4 [Candidatus Nanopelagicales bacterium]